MSGSTHDGRARGKRIAVRLAALAALNLAMAWSYAGIWSDRPLASHEHLDPYLRAAAYRSEIAAGHVPPQVFPEPFEGGGLAFPRYYPPAAYWVAALAGALTGSDVVGVNATSGLAVLLSTSLLFVLVVRLTGSATLGLLGGALYGCAPYRYVDVFVRGALAESWAFVWYPVLALGILRIARGGTPPWFLPVAVAGLLLTHTVMALYAGVLGVLSVAALFVRSERKARFAGSALAAGVIGVGLASWHLLPASSLEDIRVGEEGFVWNAAGRVERHAPAIRQLVHADPERWRGLSEPDDSDGMSFALGVADLALVPLLAAAALISLVRRRARAPGERGAGDGAPLFCAMWALAVTFVLWPGPFLAVLPSGFLMIQFPWRMLGPAAFLSAVAAALLLDRIRRMLPSTSGVGWRAGALVASALVVLGVPEYQRQSVQRQTEKVAARSVSRERAGYTALGEYLPVGLSRAEAASLVKEARARTASTPGVALERRGSTTRISVTAEAPRELVLPLIYYDFYRARGADGLRVETFPEDHLLAIRLPPGAHVVRVEPGLTAKSRAGIAISAASALALVGLGAARRERIV
jgi:hypothetical protein